MASDTQCEHKWTSLSIHYSQESDSYITNWKRLDVLMCEKCAKTKDVVREEYNRYEPLWHKR